MKVILKISGFTPDREYYRKEVITEPKIEKMTKRDQKTSSSAGTSFENKLIEIKRVEPVWEFPKEKEELVNYLKTKTRIKILGCLAKIRTYFDPYVKPSEGGTQGLKGAFNDAWNVRVREIRNVGKIVPRGLEKPFQFKGGKGGMGWNRFDQLTEFTADLEITNPPIERLAKNIFLQAIRFLECTRLGRSGQIEIIK